MGSHLVAPDGEAEELARRMLDNKEIQRDILTETIESAESGQIKESGRTACRGGRSIRGPLARFPTSVKLDGCPRSRGGTWHTHVTPDELQNPQNSLPDMANVVFGLTDVSVVTGTETAEAFIRAANPEEVKQAFADAIGVSVQSPQEVTQAVMSGGVNPTRARKRVRSQLSPLFIETRTRFGDIGAQIPREVTLSEPGGVGMREARAFHPHFSTGPANAIHSSVQQIDDVMDDCGKRLIAQSTEESSFLGNVKGLAISSAIGTVVGEVVSKTLFE